MKTYVPLDFNIIKSSIPQTGRVLDFGGGDGSDALQFAERGYTVDTVDNPVGSTRHPNISYIAGSIQDIPDHSYDVILIKHVLAFIPSTDRSNLLLLLRGHLSEHGRVILVTPIRLEGYSEHDKEISIEQLDVELLLHKVFNRVRRIGEQTNSRGVIAYYYLCQ